jgi:hypothetical protein
MRKKAVRVSDTLRATVESRMSNGESLRSVARSIGCCYQTLQYWRDKWGLPKLKPAQAYGADHPNWRGGVTYDRYGYRMIYTPGRKVHPYTYEHVLAAEKKMARRLRRGEHVHHLDGDKTNNKEENLIVLTDREHKRLHHQLDALAMSMVRDGLIVFRDGKYQRA